MSTHCCYSNVVATLRKPSELNSLKMRPSKQRKQTGHVTKKYVSPMSLKIHKQPVMMSTCHMIHDSSMYDSVWLAFKCVSVCVYAQKWRCQEYDLMHLSSLEGNVTMTETLYIPWVYLHLHHKSISTDPNFKCTPKCNVPCMACGSPDAPFKLEKLRSRTIFRMPTSEVRKSADVSLSSRQPWLVWGTNGRKEWETWQKSGMHQSYRFEAITPPPQEKSISPQKLLW